MTSDPCERLRRVLEAGISPELEAWLADGVRRWLVEGGELADALGLPRRAAEVRLALRDRWLREAAAHLGETTRWRRAKRLAVHAQRFERHAWAVWRGLALPPSSATPVEASLFFARRYGPFPATARQFANLLSETGPAPRFAVSLRPERRPVWSPEVISEPEL